MFVITSFYMAVTAVFFALYVAQDTLRHMAIIKNGWVIAATIAAALGIAGAMDAGGMGSRFALYGRAMGGFKDPNVFATYLVLPAIMLIHGFMTGTQRYRIFALPALLVILAGLFLAFSRGAWLNLAGASLLMAILTFALSPTLQLRTRIVVIVICGLLVVGGLLAILLSIPEFRDIFLDRFTLVKDYDAGETGRFGNQLNSIPMLLERPLGFGPLKFADYFHQDPHNTYLSAFASYGWLGGLSYIMIVVSTIFVGFRSVMMRTPWQHWAIIVFCPLFTTLLQSIQIDADHWRHFYWMIGMMWGIWAASWIYQRQQSAAGRS
jgi:O-antigen ligase